MACTCHVAKGFVEAENYHFVCTFTISFYLIESVDGDTMHFWILVYRIVNLLVFFELIGMGECICREIIMCVVVLTITVALITPSIVIVIDMGHRYLHQGIVHFFVLWSILVGEVSYYSFCYV